MKIKLQGQIVGIAYRKSVKLTLKFDALQLGNVASTLTLINNSFKVGIKNEEGKNYVIKNALYEGLSVSRDGDTKLKLDIEPEQMPSLKEIKDMKELLSIII